MPQEDIEPLVVTDLNEFYVETIIGHSRRGFEYESKDVEVSSALARIRAKKTMLCWTSQRCWTSIVRKIAILNYDDLMILGTESGQKVEEIVHFQAMMRN